jgi:multidrug efflux pump subunit AcrB
VVTSALAVGALFVPAAAMGGGAGLELLQPFAITLLAGLVTSVAIVLFVLPDLYPAMRGGQPAPTTPDVPEGRHAGTRHGPVPAPRPDPRPELQAESRPAGGPDRMEAER